MTSIKSHIPPLGNASTTKKLRESALGAHWLASEQLHQGTLLRLTEDSLRVSPLQPGSELWQWVQPVLSPGGHILGAPTGNAVSKEQVLKMGSRTLESLLDGYTLQTTKPQYAIPILTWMAHLIREQNGDLYNQAMKELEPVWIYSAEPDLADYVDGATTRERFLTSLKYNCISDYLSHLDRWDDPIPSWKQIQAATREIFPEGKCSNQFARYIRRLMGPMYQKKKQKLEIRALREKCLAPISSGSPIRDYIVACWKLRGSSISSELPKKPPALVMALFDALGLDSSTDISSLRSQVRHKMLLFREWTQLQHGGGGPSVWSDTLSRFASTINGSIDEYNKAVGEVELVHATSFVPGDLSPEMYMRGQCCTRYFFLGQGFFYAYSNAWRRDAWVAYLKGWLPPEVNALSHLSDDQRIRIEEITPSDAYHGGQALLDELEERGVSELVFTTFLRQYYWSGAFLVVNTGIRR